MECMAAREYLERYGDNPETRAFRASATEEEIRAWAHDVAPTIQEREGIVITDGPDELVAAVMATR